MFLSNNTSQDNHLRLDDVLYYDVEGALASNLLGCCVLGSVLLPRPATGAESYSAALAERELGLGWASASPLLVSRSGEFPLHPNLTNA